MSVDVAAAAQEMFGLSASTALVTGGGGGIGGAICRTLAELGATVYVADVDLAGAASVAESITRVGGAARAVELDVTDAQACETVVASVREHSGAITTLVACAGWTELHPVIDEDAGYWRRVTDVCYFGTVYPCVAAMRAMIDAGRGGRIVTIGSEAGRIGNAGQAVYAGAKAGVVGFTKSLAREGGRHGILANVVSPGITDTPLLGTIDSAATRKMADASVLRRWAQPVEIAAAVAFLVSPCASFITGEVLSASGGLAMVG